MKLRAIFAVTVALALGGCASWFGGGHHHRTQMGAGAQQWHPPQEMLVKYDANHDGTLTRAEMETGLRADFDKADTKHTGCLDKDEVRAVNQRRWQEDRSTASPLVDFKGLGCIDFDEFASTARSLFDQLDANGDGMLTPNELHPQPTVRDRNGAQHQWGGRHGRGQGPDGDDGPSGDSPDGE